MNNEKREQARVLNSLCAQLEYAIKQRTDEDDSLNPDAIMLSTLVDGRDVRCIRAGAAALLREAEAAERAPDVSEAELSEWDALCEKATPIDSGMSEQGVHDVLWTLFAIDGTRVASCKKHSDACYIWKARDFLLKAIAALRAARKREGEAVEWAKALYKTLDTAMRGHAVIVPKHEFDAFLAARETTQEQKNEQ